MGTLDEIKEDEGKALAKEMNTNYGAIVHGMAREKISLPFGTTMKSAKVKTVTNRGCEITVVTCTKDICGMKAVTYPFRPYLNSQRELKRRLGIIRNTVCAPKVRWLVTKPLALPILIVVGGLGYGTAILGRDGMLQTIGALPRLERGISTVFGSPSTFVRYVQGSWYISIVAHAVEGIIAAVGSSITLGLKFEVSMSWFVIVFLVGFPIFQEFNAMMSAQQPASKTK